MRPDTAAPIVWQSYLQTSPAGQRDSLLHLLTQEVALELQEVAPFPFDPGAGLEPPEQELPRIHYSWFSPSLRSMSESEIRLFLSVLRPERVKGLKAMLLLSNNLPTPTPVAKAWLARTLFGMIAPDDLLPVSCLPQNPLNALLDLSQTELSSLIDLLAMHDLSVEIRHIIETTKLKEIHSLLSKAQVTFLKTLLHKKEPVSFKKMGLVGWKGDRDALAALLVQRGINRIAKSLYGQTKSLLWYVSHRLDMEKGQLLGTLCTALDHPQASAIIGEQVIELMNTLKTTTPPQKI